jgi:hypothetical protein
LTAGIVPASILTLTEGVLFDMASFKWKTAAAALLLTSVFAGSAIVLAQGSGRALDALPSSISDRFAALEAKLDRLIQALEKGSVAANSAPRRDFDNAPPAETVVGRRNYPTDVQYAPPLGEMSAPQPKKPGYRPEGAKKGQQVADGLNTPTDDLPAGFPPRPIGLEQRVADLERRLAVLERAVGASQSSYQRSGSTEVGRPQKH